jgi:FAD/FMN-containing dehydrogenase
VCAFQVKFANQFDIPFLATNGRHGAITTQGDMKWGIQIWLDKLNKVEISKDGKSVKIGGGTLSKKVTDTLWAANKQTVTGGCECTSILGPGLGGGHGFLQGRFGLIADQFISMDVVYADGGLRTIDKNSDIWWAMQGAGHNFGIVTSVTSKIYDVKYPDWAYQSFIFTGDKVEELYTRINNVLLKNGTQPVDVMNYSFFFNNAEVDPENVSQPKKKRKKICESFMFFLLTWTTLSLSSCSSSFRRVSPRSTPSGPTPSLSSALL